ncbi:MAG: hypothetical protein JRJ57_10790 [Deltaproteobacteria bacterium]|nr:hypothetical protein [Deltaproteobacteria bacterium]
MGKLYINGVYYCDTLEDPVRDYNKDGDLDDEREVKIYGETAIPYGTYQVTATHSPKFRRLLPLVMDVPHFKYIRIHAGNSAADTHGCILVGENKQPGKVINSRAYETLITQAIVNAIEREDTVKLIIS